MGKIYVTDSKIVFTAAGKANKITITNDKGRLSKDEIERMVKDAEKFATEDEQARKRVEAKNSLENYAFSVRNSTKDENVSSSSANCVSCTAQPHNNGIRRECGGCVHVLLGKGACHTPRQLCLISSSFALPSAAEKVEKQHASFFDAESVSPMQAASKLSPEDKQEIEKAIDETVNWLDANQLADEEEYKYRREELEKRVSPLISKIYQQGAGGGGMPGAGGPPPSSGPTVEVSKPPEQRNLCF